MSVDNVISLHSGGEPPGPADKPKAPKKKRRAKPGLVFSESGEYEGFTTFDVLSGLQGVTAALKELDYGPSVDLDTVSRLAIASHVLCSMLANRRMNDLSGHNGEDAAGD